MVDTTTSASLLVHLTPSSQMCPFQLRPPSVVTITGRWRKAGRVREEGLGPTMLASGRVSFVGLPAQEMPVH